MDSLKQHRRLIIIILLLLSLCFAASGRGRGGFRGLVMMLIPLFFAVDNVLRQKQLPGSWTIRWGKFWTALALQFFILGGPLYALFLLDRADAPYIFISIILGLTVYFILTSVGYGVVRQEDIPPPL